MLPQNRCEEFRSVAQIPDGLLFRSNVDNFFIYQYSRDEELVAITLNQNVKSCGRTLYRTGIPGGHVMLLEDSESFLNNKRLRLVTGSRHYYYWIWTSFILERYFLALFSTGAKS